MSDRFVDTAGWAAVADKSERHHAAAGAAVAAVWDEGRRLVTTSYVLAELTALFSRLRLPKGRQVQFLDDLSTDPSVQIVFVDAALDAAAWALWRGRPDKDWSLVDCTSFVVMRDRGLTEAITSDHHFEQAGFARLLK